MRCGLSRGSTGPRPEPPYAARWVTGTKRCGKSPFIRSAFVAMARRAGAHRTFAVGLAPQRAGRGQGAGTPGDRSAVPALLEAAGRLDSNPATHDRILEHSLTYALIEIDDPASTSARPRQRPRLDRPGGTHRSGPDGRRGARSDQSRRPACRLRARLERGRLLDHRSSCRVGRCVLHVVARAALLANLSPADHAELERHLTQFAANGSVQDLLAAALADRTLPVNTRLTAATAMQGASLKTTPAVWVDVLVRCLAEAHFPVASAVAVLHARPVPKTHTAEVTDALLQLADNPQMAETVRLDALAAVPGGLAHASPETFAFLQKHLDAELPVTTRAAAAEVFSKARLTPDKLIRLAGSFKTVGPLEADRLSGAFEPCADEQVGRTLIAALKTSPVLTSLPVNAIKKRIARQPASVKAKAEALYALINVDLAKERQRIDQMLPLVRNGDVRRGQLVFARAKASCTSCHQFGYAGGHIGPDLTHVGNIRSERDLLEAIMFPSASIVRSFEPMQVITKAGKVYNGLIHKDAPDEIVLIASATETIHVPRDEIEEMRPSRTSIMPAGLDKQLTPQELADLVTFLRNAK